ncbi:EAL domain-containing protein [Pseudomonas kuykendallii]|uniref:putative bifunctional diguanylate cyclase/phosphodiesterase n=1 Tax=Pseudomonas kuykendallii TaxID=1007099 RepID=UPI0028D535A6|nr:EAL domain-containing protein [Pseudomonas kuykendallii]
MIGRVKGLWLTVMSVPGDNPRLLKAQYVALSRQLPMMYFILLVNTWALAVTHFDTAPGWLTLAMPALLTIISFRRAQIWWRNRNDPVSEADILATLTRTNQLAPFIAAGFTAWSLALYPYGDAYAQAHVAFFMGITVIVCIFCLMHLRSAALITTLVVDVAFVVFFASTHNPTFIATSINILLVSSAMLIVLQNNYRDFTSLVNVQAKTEQLSNENLRLANLDSLTGLPNRRQFFTTLDNAASEALKNRKRLAVGILDLDGFKPVNDLYGHSVGDKVLTLVAERLLELSSPTVHVARLGGDEFALVMKDDLSDESLQAFGRKACGLLRTEFMLADVPIHIGATLGIATFPGSASDTTQLYEYADYALYQGKRSNPGTVCLFSAGHHEQLHRDAMTEQALRRADMEDEFYVLFQPILNSHSQETVAFEALARWNSPELGQVAPGVFIPVAEHTGLISRLTPPLLGKALREAHAWPEGIRLSFNLSAIDCGSHESVQQIIALIRDSGFDPARLDLEITETAIVQDMAQMQRAIIQFRQLGCGISLDDFGTGYSSLSQLHALSLTKLKIDRSFVAGIQHNPATFKIVKSLVGLTHDMDLECVIEGVETREELAALTSLGCTQVQGYLFSRPIPAAETLAWLGQARVERLLS